MPDDEEEALVEAEAEEPEGAPPLPAEVEAGVSEASLVDPEAAVVVDEEEAPAEVAALSEFEDRAL